MELVRKHVCPDCQELRLAPLNPNTSLERSETLWETIVLDNAEFPIDGKVLHCMIMEEEASRMIVPQYLFEHEATESRNCTGPEAVQGIQDTWVRHYGLTASIRLGAEGAFRSGELQQWAEQRGVEVLQFAAKPMDKLVYLSAPSRSSSPQCSNCCRALNFQLGRPSSMHVKLTMNFQRLKGSHQNHWLLEGNLRLLADCIALNMISHTGPLRQLLEALWPEA